MGESNVNLATLIGSRICHDLISPIGAISNGLELLDMTGGVEGPEMGLIADSVGNAGARIQFFRIAFGSAGNQALGCAEIRTILQNMAQDARVKPVWTVETDRPRSEVRLALLAYLCCETAMPIGGQVEIAYSEGQWAVSGRARTLSLDPSLWEALSNPHSDHDITPAQVQFALLPAAASEIGRRISVTSGDEQVVIRF